MTTDIYEREIESIKWTRRGSIHSFIDRLQWESDFGSSTFSTSRTAFDDAKVLPNTHAATGNSNPEPKPAKKTPERVSLRIERAHGT